MTLFRLFLASLALVGSMAQAYVMPDRGDHYGPIRPGPDHGRGDWGRGDDYGPIRPGPDRGQRIVEPVYVNRYARNEALRLLEMSNIERYYGYQVEAVRVYVFRSREVNSSLELLVNGRSEDNRRVDIGAVVLTPRSGLVIGRDLRNLDVVVRGEMLIDRIEITLSTDGGGGYNPPDYGDVAVDLNLPSYLPPQDHLDLTPYIDTYSYRGYALKAVEITGYSRGSNAMLEVLLNGYAEGRIFLNAASQPQTVYSRQNLVIGSSFGSLVVMPRGDAQIIRVRLILSR